MPTQSALAALGKGLDIGSYDQAQSLRNGPEEAVLSQADTRRLLLIEAAQSGDLSAMSGRKLEQLGRAETVLQRFAQAAGKSPIQLRNELRQAADVPQELFDAAARGQADPADVLANPGRTPELVALDQADTQATTEQQVEQQIPEAVAAKLDEMIQRFGSPTDRQPALQVLSQAMTLSPAAKYSMASALLAE